ncbi:Hypothetical predicted protein [Octopus vulgaris]|uniref:Uncharacterized protein n=1 Tax=Octopus vulgaris TaxID=6645 RepID=A0AA36BQ32_OCTVU|nr:Hypothetical predicted protein [Octopus vulgaris]
MHRYTKSKPTDIHVMFVNISVNVNAVGETISRVQGLIRGGSAHGSEKHCDVDDVVLIVIIISVVVVVVVVRIEI